MASEFEEFVDDLVSGDGVIDPAALTEEEEIALLDILDDEPQKCVFVSDGVYKYIRNTDAPE